MNPVRLPPGLSDLAARHAVFYRRWLEQTGAEWLTPSTAAKRAPHLAGIGNVRAALEWCFGVNGNAEIGVRLAAAAAPAFLAMSLLTECHQWSERAILALDEATRGGPEEMRLQAALGMSLMFTGGQSEAARAALNRGFSIAEACEDRLNQLQLLCQLNMFHHRRGDFKISLHYAKRSVAVAGTIASPAAIALAHSQMGISLIYMGDLGGARAELEACLRTSIEKLRAARYELLMTAFNISLVQALTANGRCPEGFALVDESIQAVETNGDLSYMPELLRVKGNLFLSKPEPSIENAEDCFMKSLEESRRQGARSWELRTAIDLAALWAARGKPERSLALLQPVYWQFTEGFDTADLNAARRLLKALG
jgi:tetratricopeptide (TPR) repeat protein